MPVAMFQKPIPAFSSIPGIQTISLFSAHSEVLFVLGSSGDEAVARGLSIFL